MICANTLCKKEIPEGEQVAVWISGIELTVAFVCQACATLLEQTGQVKDITDEVKGPPP
jgi:hypothetical protein